MFTCDGVDAAGGPAAPLAAPAVPAVPAGPDVAVAALPPTEQSLGVGGPPLQSVDPPLPAAVALLPTLVVVPQFGVPADNNSTERTRPDSAGSVSPRSHRMSDKVGPFPRS